MRQARIDELPKPKSYVKFRLKYPEEGDQEWERAFIHSQVGKKGSKYEKCFNIQVEGDSKIQCLDW